MLQGVRNHVSTMEIQFESTTRETTILNPLKDFQPDTQILEHRKDPLTERPVIVLKSRMEYVGKFIESDQGFAEELAHSTEQNCPFCPNSVESRAPRFPEAIAPEGRIRIKDAVCFPSLFAHEDFNAIVVPSPSHSLTPNQFSARMFVEGFEACIEYFRRVHSAYPRTEHVSICMNYYPPAGSTIAHAHMQALASDIPFQTESQLLEKSKRYKESSGSSYWSDLLETEKKLGVRYLGQIHGVEWLTPFAPMGLNEVQAIVPGRHSLTSLTERNLEGVAEGISRVVRFYFDIGIRSFNMAVYSGPLMEQVDSFDVNVRIVSRYGYKPRFVSDVWALQYLLGGQEVYESPEETCAKLRGIFG